MLRFLPRCLLAASISVFLVAGGVGGSILGGSILGGSAALAQGCPAVVDETGSLDPDRVQTAVDDLRGRATAVVYLWDTVPDGDIEAAVDDLIARCFSDGPGGRRADLVLIAVSIGDRQTSLQFGSDHNAELGGTAAIIQSDVINPRLAEGDLTTAVVDGLETIDELLGPEPNQTGQDPAGNDGAVAAPAGGSGSASRWLLAGAGGVLAAGAGGAFLASRRRVMAARNSLQLQAAQPRIRMGAARERAARLGSQGEIWLKLVSGRTKQELLQKQAETRTAEASSEQAAALFRQATPDGIAEATGDELRSATERLPSFVDEIDKLNEALDQLRRFGDRVDRLRLTLPVKRDRLNSEIDESLELANEREAAGWKVDGPRQELTSAQSRLTELSFDGLEQDVLQLHEIVEEGEAVLFAARHELQTLEDTLEGLQKWGAQLQDAEVMERRRIEAATGSLAKASGVHAPESWQWAEGHPQSAAAALDEGRKLRENATGPLLKAQEWDEVGKELERAGLLLIKADDLLDDIDALVVSLEAARSNAASVLAEAATEVDELRQFVDSYDQDLSDRWDVEPDQAALAIQGLIAELRNEQPNFLRVAETADQLARRIDRLLVEVQEEQQQTASLRREIDREQARAKRELQRAKKAVGWELISSGFGRDLDILERQLRNQAPTTQSELDRLRSVADQAVQIRAEINNQRRRNSTWVVVGSSGRGSGWGGGGSSSGGGGSFGGGGTFGGGSFGGGGTFGGGSFGGGSFGGGGSSSGW